MRHCKDNLGCYIGTRVFIPKVFVIPGAAISFISLNPFYRFFSYRRGLGQDVGQESSRLKILPTKNRVQKQLLSQTSFFHSLFVGKKYFFPLNDSYYVTDLGLFWSLILSFSQIASSLSISKTWFSIYRNKEILSFGEKPVLKSHLSLTIRFKAVKKTDFELHNVYCEMCFFILYL